MILADYVLENTQVQVALCLRIYLDRIAIIQDTDLFFNPFTLATSPHIHILILLLQFLLST